MNNAIPALRILPAELDTSATGKAAGKGEFLDTLREAMDRVEELHGDAEGKVADLAGGNGMDVHSAMIAVEKADLSFQLMMQVRNKIVQAYQEISRLQF
jgi:flagellar hook-basal body complex protein FliE